ncbi:MAG: Outer membrane protein (OmpH-like) [Synergistetes bacterium ADurb.Bin520]|nr:MAG: Outer membrane protein (OmpH-like) [Synergistetes bacterium ADurb.Bin520]
MKRTQRWWGMLLVVAFVVALGAGTALAADDSKMGVLDPQKVLFNHPNFKDTQEKIQKVTENKQNEAKMAIDAESDNKKKAEIYQKKREEAAMEEQKLMEPLFKQVDTAIRTVATAKKLVIVFDKNVAFFGGVDITDDVIQELKKAAVKGK